MTNLKIIIIHRCNFLTVVQWEKLNSSITVNSLHNSCSEFAWVHFFGFNFFNVKFRLGDQNCWFDIFFLIDTGVFRSDEFWRSMSSDSVVMMWNLGDFPLEWCPLSITLENKEILIGVSILNKTTLQKKLCSYLYFRRWYLIFF